MNQNEKVLQYMERNGSIDAWRATNELHILRLASRIHDLIQSGVPVIGEMQYRRNEDGTVTKWKEYRLGKHS